MRSRGVLVQSLEKGDRKSLAAPPFWMTMRKQGTDEAMKERVDLVGGGGLLDDCGVPVHVLYIGHHTRLYSARADCEKAHGRREGKRDSA